MPADEFLVDDADLRRSRGVVLAEWPPAHDIDAECPKIRGTHNLIMRGEHARFLDRRIAGDRKSLSDVPSVERQAAADRRAGHAWNRGELPLGGLIERQQAIHAAVPIERQADRHGEDSDRPIAGIDAVQRDQRADEQSRAGQKQNGRRHLADDQRRAKSAATPRRSAPSRARHLREGHV